MHQFHNIDLNHFKQGISLGIVNFLFLIHYVDRTENRHRETGRVLNMECIDRLFSLGPQAGAGEGNIPKHGSAYKRC